jgi:hypothetical protein
VDIGLHALIYGRVIGRAPNHTHTALRQHGLWRSEDGGATWAGVGYLGTVAVVLIHPTAPSVIYAGASNYSVF